MSTHVPGAFANRFTERIVVIVGSADLDGPHDHQKQKRDDHGEFDQTLTLLLSISLKHGRGIKFRSNNMPSFFVFVMHISS